MITLSPDTSPEIEEFQIHWLRHMPAWRKMALMSDMSRTVQVLALVGLRQRYPEDTLDQRRRRLADMLLGPELAARVYGPRQEEAGC
jgi:hypothetical protein